MVKALVTVALSILRAFPNAHLTCLDLAENMIAVARAKLRAYPDVRYVLGDFKDFSGDYDAVVSSLALHHIQTDDAKQPFYRRIYDALRPGGAFYNGDVVLASSDFLQDIYMEQWRAFMSRSVPETEIEGKWIPKYYAEDHPAKLTDQLVWLTEVGFELEAIQFCGVRRCQGDVARGSLSMTERGGATFLG